MFDGRLQAARWAGFAATSDLIWWVEHDPDCPYVADTSDYPCSGCDTMAAFSNAAQLCFVPSSLETQLFLKH